MYRARSSRVLLVPLALSFIACSQRDPSAPRAADSGVHGGEDAGALDAAVAADAAVDAAMVDPDAYFPLDDGAVFTYRHVETGKTTWDDQTTLSKTTYKGKPAFLSTGSTDTKGESSDNILLKVGTKIYRVRKDSIASGKPSGSVVYEPGFLRFDTSWVGKDLAFVDPEDYRRIESDATGAVISDDNRSHTFTIEALSETITVPAGTLEGCMRVHRLRVLAMGAATSDDDDKRLWFCPGVGKAKELTITTGATEELAACTIPGRACP